MLNTWMTKCFFSRSFNLNLWNENDPFVDFDTQIWYIWYSHLLWHSQHSKRCSFEWHVKRCVGMWYFSLKRAPQSSQSYGRALLCVRWCLVKLDFFENIWPHKSHLCAAIRFFWICSTLFNLFAFEISIPAKWSKTRRSFMRSFCKKTFQICRNLRPPPNIYRMEMSLAIMTTRHWRGVINKFTYDVWHSQHSNNFSPVWIERWRFKLDFLQNIRPHSSHLCVDFDGFTNAVGAATEIVADLFFREILFTDVCLFSWIESTKCVALWSSFSKRNAQL